MAFEIEENDPLYKFDLVYTLIKYPKCEINSLPLSRSWISIWQWSNNMMFDVCGSNMPKNFAFVHD